MCSLPAAISTLLYGLPNLCVSVLLLLGIRMSLAVLCYRQAHAFSDWHWCAVPLLWFLKCSNGNALRDTWAAMMASVLLQVIDFFTRRIVAVWEGRQQHASGEVGRTAVRMGEGLRTIVTVGSRTELSNRTEAYTYSSDVDYGVF
eukprot:jgi/Ulvmu1/10249/UM060_0050.1